MGIENLAFSVEKVSQHGGHLREIIKMTVKCFEKFCLKARTTKADEIHDYYLNLEESIQELLEEETNILKNQLNIKNKCIKKIQKEIEIKISENEQRVIDNFEKIMYGGYANKEKTEMKIGYSNNSGKRLKTHKREIGSFFTYEIIIPSVYNIEIERMLKTDPVYSKYMV